MVGKIQTDLAVLETTVDGLKMSQEAVAGAQGNILNELSELKEKTSASIGFDGITNELKGIKDALYSQKGAGIPPAGAPVTARPPTPRQPEEPRTSGKKTEPFNADVDVADIDWRIKGNKDARDSDPFAYAFVYTSREQDTIRDSVREIVQLCNQYGTIKTVDGFLVKLGGTNNSLLNRNPAK